MQGRLFHAIRGVRQIAQKYFREKATELHKTDLAKLDTL